MAAYHITYYDQNETLLKSETVFMKGARAVKQSATAMAPNYTARIVICDMLDQPLLTKELGQWREHAHH